VGHNLIRIYQGIGRPAAIELVDAWTCLYSWLKMISIEAEMYKKQQILKAVGLAGERL
jgi:hemoglobin-like flavoprotein